MARLILLGTKGGPAIRTGGPSPTSSVLDIDGRISIVDCGLGVTRGFVEAGFHLTQLSTIFITHYHSDHVLELGPLLHTAWTAGLARPVQVFGPPGLARLIEMFFETHRFDIETRIDDEGRPDIRRLVETHEYTEGAVLDRDGVRVSALRNEHPPVRDSFALRFDWLDREGKGRAITFSGDTIPIEAMTGFASSADVLVHEAMLAAGVDALVARVKNGARLKEHLMASHSLAEDVGRIATSARVGHLVLHHLIPADDPAFTAEHWRAAVRGIWAGPLTIGSDGAVIEI